MISRLRRPLAALGAAVALASCTSVVRGEGTHAPPAGATAFPSPVPEALDYTALHSDVTASLPRDGRTRIAGRVDLPTGHRVGADEDFDGRADTAPVEWVTDKVIEAPGPIALALAHQFPDTGLWPVVLQAEQTDPDNGIPWLDGDFVPRDVTPAGNIDVVTAMGRWWTDNVKISPRFVHPYTTMFPGLAPVPIGVARLDAASDAWSRTRGRIGVFAVHDPADVPATIGWLGATNYFDAGYVSAVLRSWEQRFGAVLVRMGFDYLEVALRRPPRTVAQARAIAAEQVAFCPDQIYQGDYDTFAEYVNSLVDSDELYCWWD